MNPHHTQPATFCPTLGDSWRIAAQDVTEHLRFIRQYRKVISEAGERLSSGHLVHKPADVAAARAWLPGTVKRYLECVKTVSLAEQRMDAVGMRYAISSEDWRA